MSVFLSGGPLHGELPVKEPPKGRSLETQLQGPLAMAGPPWVMQTTKLVYTRVVGKPWMWKLSLMQDITEQVAQWRAERMRRILDGI